jgi:hypothetical protein
MRFVVAGTLALRATGDETNRAAMASATERKRYFTFIMAID